MVGIDGGHHAEYGHTVTETDRTIVPWIGGHNVPGNGPRALAGRFCQRDHMPLKRKGRTEARPFRNLR